MGTLSNITIERFRDYLRENELTCIRVTGGHEVWSKDGLSRPVIIQTHIDTQK